MFRKKNKKEDLPEDLSEVVKELVVLRSEIKSLKDELHKTKEEQQFFLKNIKITRFNPFNEEGGNQSFSLALLDKNGDGAVLTSLYTKEGNRVYGKPVVKGGSEFSLSEEEKKVINNALKEKKL
jgi:hypothetical protein